jgi:PAT family beta-lactamase induction signal transducer AmpG
VLRRDEQGIATGSRTAFYRAAMLVAGGASITLAASTSWAFVNLMLALVYLPFMIVTALAPEPDVLPPPPRSMREAVWGPFVGFLGQHRSLEILGFVVLYKLSDNLTQSLTGPFLVQTGFATSAWAWPAIGQPPSRASAAFSPIAWGAAARSGSSASCSSPRTSGAAVPPGQPPVRRRRSACLDGLGSGAFGVLLRLTQKRFSATQYALLSSLFTLPRVLAGPVTGVLADAMGWRDFFVLTVVFGVPGLLMLARFVPWNARDVEFEVEAPPRGSRLSRAGLAWRVAVGASATLLAGLGGLALVAGLTGIRAGRGFDAWPAVVRALAPASAGEWTTTAGLLVLAGLGGLVTAATLVARHGLAARQGR